MDVNIDTLVYALQLWLTVASGEVVIMTLIWKYKLGEWWWNKKPRVKEWEFKMTSDSWSLSGQGHNPLQTLTNMIESWTSPVQRTDKQLAKIHDKLLLEEVMALTTTEEYRSLIQNEAKLFLENIQKGRKQ